MCLNFAFISMQSAKIIYTKMRKRQTCILLQHHIYSDITTFFGLYNYMCCSKWWSLASRYLCVWWTILSIVMLAKVSNGNAAHTFSISCHKSSLFSAIHNILGKNLKVLNQESTLAKVAQAVVGHTHTKCSKNNCSHFKHLL